jgi:hypothetical protein
LSSASISAAATAELLPCSTKPMRWSSARAAGQRLFGLPLLSKRTSASGRAPPGSAHAAALH